MKSKQAILVIHGIGQKERFQTLGEFVQGIRKILDRNSLVVAKAWRDDEIEYFLRLEGRDKNTDIYEFYWAPYTAGKTSVRSILQWLLTTGFTPFRRLAFNVPLLLHSAKRECQYKVPEVLSIVGDELGIKFKANRLWGNYLKKVFAHAISEVGRIAMLVVIASVVYITGGYLISSVDTLISSSTEIISTVRFDDPFEDIATSLLLMGLIASIISIFLSLKKQFQDIRFTFRNNPIKVKQKYLLQIVAVMAGSYNKILGIFNNKYLKLLTSDSLPALITKKILSKLLNDEQRSKFKDEILLLETREDEDTWITEVSGRILLIVLYLAVTVCFIYLVYLIIRPDSLKIFGFQFSPIISKVLAQISESDVFFLFVVGVVLLFAYIAKKVIIDFVADIAVYTTLDEHSPYFEVREEILDKACRKMRGLVRNYESVSIVGHSLGSVIAYDTITRLRDEIEIGDYIASDDFKNSEESASSTLKNSAVRPLRTSELNHIDTLVTFGSPLDKIFYFFSTKVRTNEVVRNCLLNELQHFRRKSMQLFSDNFKSGYTDNNGEMHLKSDDCATSLQQLYWLNVSSWADPISSKLSYYEVDYEYRINYRIYGLCHTKYWHDEKFYKQLTDVIYRKKGDDQKLRIDIQDI